MVEFIERISAMRQQGQFFLPGRSIFVGRAPGRLDLMGGNDDYTGGLVFEATIREATWAAVQLRDDHRIVFLNPQMREQGWHERVEFDLRELTNEQQVRDLAQRDSAARWTAYVIGAFFLLRQRYPDRIRSGASVYIESNVPLNKGVSSSASLEVAVMKPAARAYGIDLDGVELAVACQWVENVIAQSACGIMDQITVVLGDEGHILPLVCQPCIPQPLVRLPEALQVWAIDSGVSHCVSGIEYEASRAAAFMGYKMICDQEGLPVTNDTASPIPRFTDPRWNGYLANVSPSLFRSRYEQRLPETMSGADYLRDGQVHVDPFTTMRAEHVYRVRANTRYAVEENARVRLFAELARGASEEFHVGPASCRSDWKESGAIAFELMGELMYQSHYAYTECGLGAEVTDLLVELAREEGVANGIYGAKVTGGGAGGTVAFLGKRDAEPAFQRIVNRYTEARGRKPYVFEGSSIGADRFGVTVLEG